MPYNTVQGALPHRPYNMKPVSSSQLLNFPYRELRLSPQCPAYVESLCSPQRNHALIPPNLVHIVLLFFCMTSRLSNCISPLAHWAPQHTEAWAAPSLWHSPGLIHSLFFPPGPRAPCPLSHRALTNPSLSMELCPCLGDNLLATWQKKKISFRANTGYFFQCIQETAFSRVVFNTNSKATHLNSILQSTKCFHAHSSTWSFQPHKVGKNTYPLIPILKMKKIRVYRGTWPV